MARRGVQTRGVPISQSRVSCHDVQIFPLALAGTRARRRIDDDHDLRQPEARAQRLAKGPGLALA